MRTYEALYIVQPTLNDDEVQTIASGVEKLITDNGGAIVRSEIWGKRRLAYEVKKFQEGVYVLVRFEAEPAVVDRLENHFRLQDPVIRFLVVHFDEKMLRLEAEQQRRSAEQAQARSAESGRDEDEDERPRRPREPRAAERTEPAERQETAAQPVEAPAEASPAPAEAQSEG